MINGNGRCLLCNQLRKPKGQRRPTTFYRGICKKCINYFYDYRDFAPASIVEHMAVMGFDPEKRHRVRKPVHSN